MHINPTADIYVTYPHRSLEEFFGSFGFLQALDDGRSVDDILGSDCEEPIFIVSPLVLQFCLWLLTTTTECFKYPGNSYQKLVLFAAKRIGFRFLDTKAIERVYPAISICDALLDTDSLKLKFLKDVLEKCQYIRSLDINNGENKMCHYEQVDKVLELMSSNLLSKLTCLSITGKYSTSSFHQDPLAISIDSTDPETFHKYLNILLPKYNLLESNPQVYANVHYSGSLDLSTLITKHIKQLSLFRHNIACRVNLPITGKFPHCRQLTHVALNGCHIDDSVPSAFMKAVQNGELPNLKEIALIDCTGRDCVWPEVQEFSFKIKGKLDTRRKKKILLQLTALTIDKPSDIDLIPVRLENLSVMNLQNIDSYNLQQINYILKKGKLPNWKKLDISSQNRVRLDTFPHRFDPNHTVNLEKLALHQFTISAEDLKILFEKLTDIQLTELDLCWSSGFIDNLSVLFTHSFPTLNTLILQGCELNSNDLLKPM